MEYCDLIVNTLDSMCRGKPGDDDDFARCDFHIKRMGWSSRNLSEVKLRKIGISYRVELQWEILWYRLGYRSENLIGYKVLF